MRNQKMEAWLMLVGVIVMFGAIAFSFKDGMARADARSEECKAKGGKMYYGRGSALCLKPESIIELSGDKK